MSRIGVISVHVLPVRAVRLRWLEVFWSGDQGSRERQQLSWTAIVLGSDCRFVSFLLPLGRSAARPLGQPPCQHARWRRILFDSGDINFVLTLNFSRINPVWRLLLFPSDI